MTGVIRYQVVPTRSKIWIDARSNVHPIHSTADGLEGFVEYDNAGSLAAAELWFPVNKLSSGNPLERRELQKRIDAAHYPTISGVLTSAEPHAADGSFRLRGDLTFRGVTRSVEGDVEIANVDDRTVRLGGASTFDIRDFGMDPPRILVLRVEPDVSVRIEIIAERA
jgi:polyisoprenoid-binding protein YceI